MVEKKHTSLLHYFSRGEFALWLVSAALVTTSFLLLDGSNLMSLIASLIGVTSLIFCAKGNPIGQMLIILFSIFYGMISYSFAYYGEMITYLGMTAPMAVFALISWLKNPYQGNKSEVAVNRLQGKEYLFMLLLTALVTAIFYRILDFFHTANLLPSTISVATSFLAVYLTFRRSALYALAYAANDIVLVVLWMLAARADRSFLPVAICFMTFLANDIYGYLSWSRMQKRQEKDTVLHGEQCVE